MAIKSASLNLSEGPKKELSKIEVTTKSSSFNHKLISFDIKHGPKGFVHIGFAHDAKLLGGTRNAEPGEFYIEANYYTKGKHTIVFRGYTNDVSQLKFIAASVVEKVCKIETERSAPKTTKTPSSSHSVEKKNAVNMRGKEKQIERWLKGSDMWNMPHGIEAKLDSDGRPTLYRAPIGGSMTTGEVIEVIRSSRKNPWISDVKSDVHGDIVDRDFAIKVLVKKS